MLLLGLDIGAISLKAALLGTGNDLERAAAFAGSSALWHPAPLRTHIAGGPAGLSVTATRRLKGRPLEATRDLLAAILAEIPSGCLDGLRVTGAGGGLVAEAGGFATENEFRALTAATQAVAPATRTLFEIGGESSKMIVFAADPRSGELSIADYRTNGDCAAGTGSFLDQQAGRLRYEIEEVGRVASASERAAKIAGRCSVFAKSDMIHAQQKGYLPPEVLRGLCETVARNFNAAVARDHKPHPPVLFVGGVAANEMVVSGLRHEFALGDELTVPVHHDAHAAIGAALREAVAGEHRSFSRADLAGMRSTSPAIPRSRQLKLDRVVNLRDRLHPFVLPESGAPVEVTLGIDIGSVSTNVVLLDRAGRVVREIYTRTQARPVEVVTAALAELRAELGARVIVRAVGTTGSGRELIGELVGADTINDEITAHKTGATFIARTMLDTEVNTIFEIGGQDAKYIRIEDGVVVDFAMNEACAAGTGSFLEERAEELGVCIKDEFASRALASTHPVRLGERCTVFMERDVNAYQQRGAATDDLLAGLALSVATNYVNRVVRDRKIDGTIFFQGGTAYNDAVAAAFAAILDREIIVPPYNGVIGAVGAALLAWEKAPQLTGGTRFRGFDLGQVDYRIREFTCRACENLCAMQEFRVEGEKTYWGDQCGERYRRRAKVEHKPVIADLLKLRKEWLLAGHDEAPAPALPPAPGHAAATGRRATVAFPRALYFHDRFPYWNAFFRALDFGVRLGPESNRALAHDGIEAAVAEPCFPIQIAHGHVKAALAIREADFVFVPNYVNAEAADDSIQSFFCPWVMTLPFVVSAAAAFEAEAARIMRPLIRFRGGPRALEGPLHDALRPYGVTRREIAPALAAGEAALAEFRRRIRSAGADALATLARTREPAVVLVGRPYNLFDPVVNLDVPRKLRDLYGVNVVPLEFLADDDQVIEEINANMFWSYGRRILAACREAARHSDLHLIYITNFKCGPDSYIKHFVRDAFGRAFLTLQFDGHANDAGMLTRVEAYLDSQGFLRRARPQAAADAPVPAPWAAGVAFSDETAVELDAGADIADIADANEAPAAPAPPRTRGTTRAPERSEVDTR